MSGFTDSGWKFCGVILSGDDEPLGNGILIRLVVVGRGRLAKAEER